jgi:tetratricopeptide (TPR) repeat protein
MAAASLKREGSDPPPPPRTDTQTASAAAQDGAPGAQPGAADRSIPGQRAGKTAAPSGDDPAAVAERLMRRLEGRGLARGLEELAAERRAAPGLVSELLARPDAHEAAATDPRLATPEVVWRLLEVSREESAATAVRQLALGRDIASRLTGRRAGERGERGERRSAGARPGAHLALQLRVEVACELAQRLIDNGNPTGAEQALHEAGALLPPDQGYPRAVYCRAMAKLRRAQHRWEEALALGDRAIRLLRQHGTAPERAAATVEQGWLMLEAGDADDAAALFKRVLAAVETIPYPAIYCRLGLAVALVESGQSEEAGDIDQLLVDSEWMIGQTRLPVDPHRLRSLAAHAAARCRRDGRPAP